MDIEVYKVEKLIGGKTDFEKNLMHVYFSKPIVVQEIYENRDTYNSYINRRGLWLVTILFEKPL